MPKLVVVNRAGVKQDVEAAAGVSVMEAIRDAGFDELLALCVTKCLWDLLVVLVVDD